MGTPGGKGLDLECMFPFSVKQICKGEESLVENNGIFQNPYSVSSSSSSSSPPVFNGNTIVPGNCTEDVYWDGTLIKTPPPFSQEFLEQYLINASANQPAPQFSATNDENTVRQWRIGSSIFGDNDSEWYSEKPLKLTPKTEANNKNLNDEALARTVERRQRRMMKNRESAAQSRARKQAYFNQLQYKVKQLQDTNEWLTKKKEQCERLNSNELAQPRYQLRRTSSF